MYSPALTASTAIHAHHCSTYFHCQHPHAGYAQCGGEGVQPGHIAVREVYQYPGNAKQAAMNTAVSGASSAPAYG